MPFRPIPPSPPAVPSPIFVRARTRPSSPAFLPDAEGSPPDPEPPTKPKRKHHVVDRTGPNWDENGDYIVGRNRPAKDKQWVKGQSGNPRGPKPREKFDPANELIDEILSPFTTTVNGQPIETTSGKLGINVLKAKAAKLDRLSAIALLDRYEAALRERYTHKHGDEIPPEQQAMIDELFDTAGWEKIKAVRNRLGDSGNEETGDE